MKIDELKRVPFINDEDQPKTFSIRASLIMKVGDKFLMVQNEEDTRFKHPGGHIDIAESIPEALAREVEEETGLRLNDLPKEPEFFDKVLHGNNIMINAYFVYELDIESANEATQNSPLPSILFALEDLDNELTYESEIRAIKALSTT